MAFDRAFFWALAGACVRWRTLWLLLRVALVVLSVRHFPLGRAAALLGLGAAWALYYYVWVAAPTKIYAVGTETEQRILRRMPCVRGRGYYPTPFLSNPHVQTLFSALGRPLPAIPFQRQLSYDVFDDGEVCVVDWAFADSDAHEAWQRRNEAAGRAAAVPLTATSLRASGAASSSGIGSHGACATSGPPEAPTSSASTLGAAASAPSARLSFRSAADYTRYLATGREPKAARKQRQSVPFAGPGPHSPEALKAHCDDMALRLRSGLPPVLVVFHGLTGGSEDKNVYYVCKWALQRGWHVSVPVRRGCADSTAYMRRGKHYAYGGLEDTAHVVNHVCDSMPLHPVYAVGLSAGSNVMVNYMAVHGRASRIYGAVSVANGYCWEAGTAAIRDTQPVWDVLMTAIVNATLYDRHREAGSNHAGAKDDDEDDDAEVEAGKDPRRPAASPIAAVARALALRRSTRGPPRSIRTYDELVSKEIHGFETLSEFYAEQSCLHRLHRLKAPVVFLNALDDPLASSKVIPYNALLRHPHALLVCTPRGGHLGWATGWWPFRASPTWMETFIQEALHGLADEALRRVDRLAEGDESDLIDVGIDLE